MSLQLTLTLSEVRNLNTIRTLFRAKPRPASGLLLRSMTRYLRRRILNFGHLRIPRSRRQPGCLAAWWRASRFARVDHLECPTETAQIDHVARGRSQYVPEIRGDRRDLHADPVSAQLDYEIGEIGVASHEDHSIGPHLEGKLERVDCHHHVHVRLVMTFFGGRTIFGHNHESIGAQPMNELVFPVPLVLPG